MLTNRAAPSEHLSRERLVDYDNLLSARDIPVAERASLEQANPHHVNIIRADCRDRDRLGRTEVLGALDTQHHRGIVGRAQRIALRQRRLFDARQAADLLERRLKKS